MSFILDALKKSEAERQRQTGPTLLELRVTHPRRRYPTWVIVIGSLLAVNAIVLLFVALHRPTGQSGGASAAAAAAPAAAATAVAALPAPATSAVASSAASAKPAAAAAVPALAATADDAASATTLTTPRNPADDEPAVAVPTKSQTPANYTDLPSAASLGDSLPALQLNMLVSSKDTGDRYALINMHRVHEGDVLPEGARVLAITPDGVAMEYHGQDFLLPRAATPAAQ